MRFESLPQMFFERARALADRPRYRFRTGDTWNEVTWRQMAERVSDLAAGLLEMGVAVGDRVALLSATRAEWMEVDLATLACGALFVHGRHGWLGQAATLPARATQPLRRFRDMMERLRGEAEGLSIKDLLSRILELTGYSAALAQEDSQESQDRESQERIPNARIHETSSVR